MNIGTFAGRVGRDASTKEYQPGKFVTNFSLAVDVGFGEKKETDWIDSVIFGERGAKVAQYITKGKAMTIMGRVRAKHYQAKDGTTKASISCEVIDFTLQGSGPEAARPTTAPAAAPAVDEDFNDSIPFAFLVPVGASLLGAAHYAATMLA